MKRREEIEKLLGGYAAGTLTPTEREELFAAAMDDQELFDMLAEEQALKEILDDPEDRKFLRESLGEVTAPATGASSEEKKPWWRLSFWPMAAGLATVAAGLAVVTVIGIQQTTRSKGSPEMTASSKAAPPSAEPPKEVADARTSAAPPPVAVPERARPAKPLESRPAEAPETKAVSVKDTVVASQPPPADLPKREADQKPAEASTDKQQAAVAAPAAPPPPPQPVQAAAAASPEVRKEKKEDAGGPSASQLYQAQLRQMQMAQEMQQNRRQQQQLSRFSAGETRNRDLDTRAKRAPTPPSAVGGASSGRASAAAPPGGAPQQAEEAEAGSQGGPVRNAGIRYQILRRNSQSQFVETRLDTRFEAGDEIAWKVEKNSGGIAVVLIQAPGSTGLTPVTMASQTLFEAITQPVKLPKGDVEFVLMLTPNGAARADASGVVAPPSQLTEASGNSVYVVAPGIARSPVTARIRISVK